MNYIRQTALDALWIYLEWDTPCGTDWRDGILKVISVELGTYYEKEGNKNIILLRT